MCWVHLFQSIYYLLTPTTIEIGSVYVGEDREISENINERMFNHSFSYLKLSLPEKMERFRALFDCQVSISRHPKVRITTRATLRTVLAICVNPFVQVVIRKQPNFWMSFVVQALFIGVVLQKTKFYAQRRERKLLEMSLWLNDSRLF